MGRGFKLGTIAGIPLRIHYTFLVILPFLAFDFAWLFRDVAEQSGEGPSTWRPVLYGLGLALALFGSVLVHELAHSLYAMRKGARVREITLLMIGGVSQMEEMPAGVRTEAVMAFVGPLTSLLLGGVFIALGQLPAHTGFLELSVGVTYLGFMNVALGLFNLLPAFPMDGGRVLRSLLAPKMGEVRATQLAATVGKVFALVFAAVGLFGINLVLLFVALFVYIGAESESRSVLVRTVLGEVRVRDFLTRRIEPVDASSTAYEAAERMIRDRELALPVLEEGRPAGAVSAVDIERIPAAMRVEVPVKTLLHAAPVVAPDDDLARVLQALSKVDGPLALIVEGETLVGVIRRSDIARGLELRELEWTQHHASPRWRVRRDELPA